MSAPAALTRRVAAAALTVGAAYAIAGALVWGAAAFAEAVAIGWGELRVLAVALIALIPFWAALTTEALRLIVRGACHARIRRTDAALQVLAVTAGTVVSASLAGDFPLADVVAARYAAAALLPTLLLFGGLTALQAGMRAGPR